MDTLPIKIMCTLGPSSLGKPVLEQMEKLGVSILRINLSHTPLEGLGDLIGSIRESTNVPLCIDTEGAQIRTGGVSGRSIVLQKGDSVTLLREDTEGTSNRLTLRPPKVFDALEPGTLLSLDFNGVLLLVVENNRDWAVAHVLSGGKVGSNKGVSADRNVALPGLTLKDRQAIDVALACGIDLFALSFASDEASIMTFRDLVGPGATVISKVESRSALAEIDGIISASNAILIDRADLSKDFPVEYLPYLQKRIIAKAHQKPLPVYLAANLLESMVSSPHPTRAEVSDIISSLFDGANGLVLAAETAIGNYPVQCVAMVRRLISFYLQETWSNIDIRTRWSGQERLLNAGSSLIGQTTGKLPSIGAGAGNTDDLPRLVVNPAVVRDVEQIAQGTYSPVSGFMGREDINSVLDHYSLSNGQVWTLPIVLPVASGDLHSAIGDNLLLVCSCCTQSVASMKVNDIYKFDRDDICRRWFGTSDQSHPGVAALVKQGDCFIGGQITLLNHHSFAKSQYSLSPAQVRAIWAHNGWDVVVGFHTRNTPHRAHEFIQLEAMERLGAHGLFIHPVLGQKKSGDFSQEAILAGYEALINARYPKDRVLLSGFFGNSWYSGPREAVFTAICRRNFGCSHFIVGRDHTGVGDFYKATEVAALFEKLGDIGIEPVFFDQVAFDQEKNRYLEVPYGTEDKGLRSISGSAIRQYIANGQTPPEWMMRPEVSEALLRMPSEGGQIFEP